MKIFKSKTIDFNILVGGIFTILKAFGVEVPEEVMVAVLTIGNFILRLITTKPVSEK